MEPVLTVPGGAHHGQKLTECLDSKPETEDSSHTPSSISPNKPTCCYLFKPPEAPGWVSHLS